MSFRDFNDEGPGTFAWDYVLGQNTTGLFPDETHYVIEDDVLEEVIFTYAGGETWNMLIGECWNISNISHESDGSVIFEQDGYKFRATPARRLHMKNESMIDDIKEI